MAHFAELDDNSIVLRVIVVSNEDAPDEPTGIAFCEQLLGGTWKQTSYNTKRGVHLLGGTPFRKNFAEPNFVYDMNRDAFIEPSPYPSWVFNEDACAFDAPVPYPMNETGIFTWDETTGQWVERFN